MSVITADKTKTDTPAFELFGKVKSKLPFLLVSRAEELDYEDSIDQMLEGKPYILCDYIEGGWDLDYKETLVVGKNLDKFPFLRGDGWKRLNDFVARNKPVLYFKRELLKKDASDTVLPVEYVNLHQPYDVQRKEDFDRRPILAFHYWGRSHEARLLTHGKFWEAAAKRGYAVCDSIMQFNDFMHHEKDSKKLVTLHMPWYARIGMGEILKINGASKLSISLPGSGIKCFRSAEAPVNSIMVMAEDEQAWTYSWIHEINCIKFSTNGDVTGLKNEWDIIGTIEEALQREDLYSIYLNGVETAGKYETNRYIQEYLEPIIAKICR